MSTVCNAASAMPIGLADRLAAALRRLAAALEGSRAGRETAVDARRRPRTDFRRDPRDAGRRPTAASSERKR